MRVPEHIGIIPDGNRRWAENNNLHKKEGYLYGLSPGLEVVELAREKGVKELTFYGFTMDNTKRPSEQREAFTKACVKAVNLIATKNVSLLVVGNTDSPMFPEKLLPYTEERIDFGSGDIKINLLVNYGWHWDLRNVDQLNKKSKQAVINALQSSQISRIDLIIRWGNRRRLSGFLPAQSVYADIYVVDDYWPNFKSEHFHQALEWYDQQDITLGG